MDSTSSGQIRGRGRNKRVWTPGEDEKLVECLVELCVSGKGHKDANGLRLKPFPHFDDLSLVFGKDRANGKGAMSATDILEELDQVEASNDIGVDDLEAEISDLIILMQNNWPTLACPSGNGTKFWAHEWNKHGTCSESVLSQHQYFKAALGLKKDVDLLQILEKAGIKPNGESYCLKKTKKAIKDAVGFTPWIQCNVAPSGNRQLYQVYVCVDTSGKNFIQCPVMPKGKCGSSIEFPSF
ncbi:extracellular ribonuclease LE [Vitis vinifera]|nr:extracellular ribonuclease LE [Vitis vinifera]